MFQVEEIKAILVHHAPGLCPLSLRGLLALLGPLQHPRLAPCPTPLLPPLFTQVWSLHCCIPWLPAPQRWGAGWRRRSMLKLFYYYPLSPSISCYHLTLPQPLMPQPPTLNQLRFTSHSLSRWLCVSPLLHCHISFLYILLYIPQTMPQQNRILHLPRVMWFSTEYSNSKAAGGPSALSSSQSHKWCRQEIGLLLDLPSDPSYEDQSVNPSYYHFGLLFEPVKSIQGNMVAEEELYPGFLEVLQNLPWTS